MSGFRSILALVFGAGIWLVAAPSPGAAPRTAFVEQLVAQAVSVSGPENAGRIDIYIERWSADEELDSLRGPLVEGAPGKLLATLHQLRRRAGVVLMPGVQGRGARVRTRTPRNLLFAREITTQSGRQVVAASYEHLGLGEARLEARRSVQEFNLIDIRFGPDGVGVGKVAAASDVVHNPAMKILEVKNYATQPVRLIGVRSEKP